MQSFAKHLIAVRTNVVLLWTKNVRLYIETFMHHVNRQLVNVQSCLEIVDCFKSSSFFMQELTQEHHAMAISLPKEYCANQ